MGCENGTDSHGVGRAREGDPGDEFCTKWVSSKPRIMVCTPRQQLMTRYQVATGSGDDTVRIWDLRALKTQYIIPAHKSSVSDLRFFRASAELPHIPLDAYSTTNGQVNGSGGMDVDSQSHTQANGTGTNGETNPNPDISMDTPDPALPADHLPRSGLFLVTAGFDCNVRIWSADEWNLIRNLATDAGKVMSVDVSGDGKFIASASYSRSFHLFGGDHSL